MKQKNRDTGKEREIRPPMGRGKDGRQVHWKAPSAPIVPPGETTCVSVPPGGPGTVIHVPFPNKPGKFIAVNVPANAKVGQAMLVPSLASTLPNTVSTPRWMESAMVWEMVWRLLVISLLMLGSSLSKPEKMLGTLSWTCSDSGSATNSA